MTAQRKTYDQSWTSGCKCITKKFEHIELVLDKSQYLVGSSAQADLTLEHPSIAYFHALFIVTDEGTEVLDLTPSHQMSVNGVQIHRHHLLSGDRLKLGQLEFIFEAPETTATFEERNPKLKKFAMPPAPPLKVVPVSSHSNEIPKGHVYIDGELCHLAIDDKSYKYADSVNLLDIRDISKSYIDIEERELLSYYPEKIKKEEETIIISYFCSGQLVAMDTFSGKKISSRALRSSQMSPELAQWWMGQESVVTVEGGQYYFHCPASFHAATEKMQIFDEITSLTFGVHQITMQKRVLRKDARFFAWWRDKEAFFRSLAYFFAILIPATAILLVDIPEFKEPEKEKVVIYTTEVIEEAEEPREVSSGAIEQQNQQQNQAQQSPVVDPNKGQPDQQQAKTKEDKVEPAKPKPAEEVASKFASLFAKSKLPVDDKKFDESSNSTSTSTDAHRKALSGSATGQAKTVGGGQIKGLAVDAGLSGKKGFKSGKGVGKGEFDSNFTSAKTVVLGSIDPELLRKLLREYIPQFRYCYQSELIKNPNLSGTLNLNFTLNGKGKVVNSNVIAKGTQFSAKGLSCMDGVLKMIPFPAPKGGGQVDVRQPLNFSAERTKL